MNTAKTSAMRAIRPQISSIVTTANGRSEKISPERIQTARIIPQSFKTIKTGSICS
jgi:hypothetical protein